MNEDDYLWDGSGTPDPDVQRLEELLRPMRYTGEVPQVQTRSWAPWIAVGVLLAAAAALFVWSGSDPAGFAFEGGGCAEETCVLAVGDWLETGDGTATLEVADIGQMEVAQHSRLRLKATGADEHRLELSEGSVHVSVIAPPRLLIVETPAATAVDLGCEYELAVEPDGRGTLAVQSGWVALESTDRISTVPAGAMAQIRPGDGPGTPYFEDASAAFRQALTELDEGLIACGPDLLSEARPRDTLSLFHLLYTVSVGERKLVLDRIVALSPHVNWRQVPLDAALGLEPDAMDELFTELTTTWEN